MKFNLYFYREEKNDLGERWMGKEDINPKCSDGKGMKKTKQNETCFWTGTWQAVSAGDC